MWRSTSLCCFDPATRFVSCPSSAFALFLMYPLSATSDFCNHISYPTPLATSFSAWRPPVLLSGYHSTSGALRLDLLIIQFRNICQALGAGAADGHLCVVEFQQLKLSRDWAGRHQGMSGGCGNGGMHCEQRVGGGGWDSAWVRWETRH